MAAAQLSLAGGPVSIQRFKATELVGEAAI